MVACQRMVLGAVALAVALAPVWFATTAGAHAQHVTAVGVSEQEYRVAVYRASLPSGLARFNVSNVGEDVHDLVVRTPGGRTVARVGKLGAGERATVQVRLAPGAYRLVCTLADHARLGMRATIRVQAPPKPAGKG